MNIEKIKLIDTYISKNNTGRSANFASKIQISRGMLYRYIKYMKEELQAPIVYNKSRETYQYSEKGNLCIKGWTDQHSNPADQKLKQGTRSNTVKSI